MEARIALSCMVLGVTSMAAGADVPDVFKPYLRDDPPPIVEELPEQSAGNVRVREFWFHSRQLPSSGEAYEIHCVLARPSVDGPHPAVIVCHGGSGHLDMTRETAVGWAERGYVSITQDTPGFCNRAASTSRGPYFSRGGDMFYVAPDPAESSLCDGIIAVLNSLAILRAQADVDKARVGITGGSCGGYMTTVVAGLAGDRIRAAFSIYAGGFFDLATVYMPRLKALNEQQRQWWLETLDAGRHAARMEADYMVLAAANDWFFWPPSVEATLDKIPGYRNGLFSPNDYHQIRQPGGTVPPPAVNRRTNRTSMEIRYMDWKLRGTGAPFPECKAAQRPEPTGDRVKVRFRVTAARPIAVAHAWWSAGEMPWRFRAWERVPATAAPDGVYESVLPVDEPEYPIDWVGIVTDDQYASVSTRIQRVNPGELGFASSVRRDRLFSEDFEGGPTTALWRWASGSKRGAGGTYGITAEAARRGKKGLFLHGPYSCCVWGIRAAALRGAGATGIRFWARSAAEPFAGLQPILVVELEGGVRHFWVASKVAESTLTREWQQFEVRWDEFARQGKQSPVALLSDGLGELRFTLDGADQAVHIDDLEVFTAR